MAPGMQCVTGPSSAGEDTEVVTKLKIAKDGHRLFNNDREEYVE